MKQEQFLDVTPVAEAHRLWHDALALAPMPTEEVALAVAHGRVLADDVRAPSDVPAFDRSNVDGFAVRAADTAGASEREPATLRLAGAAIDAGHAPEGEVETGGTRAIATGGVIPRGADAVVMVEDTEVAGDRVLVFKPVAAGGRISAAGSDVAREETVLRRGTPLSARETGTLAACGIAAVPCVGRVRVAIISTGDEIVPPGTSLAVGQVHDANATLIADAVRELGADAEVLGIAPDEEGALRTFLERARAGFDVTLLSGGTSKGGGDLSYRVLAEMAPPVVHGVALKPGKPLCLSAWDRKPVAVLPGFPTSAIFTFHAFIAPVLRRLMGRRDDERTTLPARVPRRITSDRGRREFTLVSLVRAHDAWVAYPMGRGSGSVTTFARADGFFEIPSNVEYVDAGEAVDVTLLGRELAPADLVLVGSHCTGLDIVLAAMPASMNVKVITTGSLGGLHALEDGACDIAPVHLLDPASHEWNAPPDGARKLDGYQRRQGPAYRTEHEAHFAGEDVNSGLKDVVRQADLRFANRNPASGTRVIVNALVDGLAKPPGWSSAYRSHTAVAAAIAQHRADYGICLEQAAHGAGLGWRPWREEHYDFLVRIDAWEKPAVRAFREVLAKPEVRTALKQAGFVL